MWRAVQLTQTCIEPRLVSGLVAYQGRRDFALNVRDRLEDATPLITFNIAVAQLICFRGAGRCAGRNRGSAYCAILQLNLCFNCRSPARVEYLTGPNCVDSCQLWQLQASALIPKTPVRHRRGPA